MLVGFSAEYCLYIFKVNQINQLYLSNNKASSHHIYVKDAHREKLCFTWSSTRIYGDRSLATSDIFHLLKKQVLLKSIYSIKGMLKSIDVWPKWFTK